MIRSINCWMQQHFRHFIILIFLLGDCCLIPASGQSYQATLGGSGYERGNDALGTLDGGYIITGGTQSSGAGLFDTYIAKISSSGALEWTRSVGGASNDEGYGVIQTADGGYAITGYTQSFGAGAKDIYLIRLNSAGVLLWTRTFGTSGNDIGEGLLELPGGGLILTGYSSPTTSSVPDGYVIRTDATGNLITCKRIGSAGNDYMHHIIRTYDNGFAIAGSTLSTSGMNYNAWVVKLDSSLNMMWNTHIGGPMNENAASLVQTADSGLAVAGFTDSYGAGGRDLYLMKLNKNGSLLWTRTTGGAQDDEARSILLTSYNELVLGGYSYSYATSSPTSLGYVVKFDASGNLMGRSGIGGYYGLITQNVFQNQFLQITNPTTTSYDIYLTVYNSSLSSCGVQGQYATVNATGGSTGSTGTVTTEVPTFGSGGVTSSGGTLTMISGPPPAPGAITATGGNTKVCPGDSKTYSIAPVAGATGYTWYGLNGMTINSGQGTTSITVTFTANLAASDTIRVVAFNSCGNSTQSKLRILRNNPARPGLITGQNFGNCNLGTLQYSVANTAGVTYNWSLNNTTASVSSGQGTNVITVAFNPGFLNAVLSVTATNACGSSTARTMNLYAKPSTPASVTGPLSVCANQQSVPYSIAPVPYATTYTWIAPSGSHINDGVTTSPLNTLTTTATSVTVNYGTLGGTLKVRGNNACTSGSYKSVTVAIVCREMDNEPTSFELFPNPANNHISIRTGTDQPVRVELYDLTGRAVTSWNIIGENGEIDVSELEAGIYFYTVLRDSEQLASGKLIIE